MNSDDLSLFARVLKAGSVSRAALDAGLDQSTISRRISGLEAELGVRLLHRSGRGVTGTESGLQLLEHALIIEKHLEEARLSMGDRKDLAPSRLYVAAQPTIARMVFPALAKILRERYPKTRLRFVEAHASLILEKLAEGALDFALIYVPEHPGALQFDLLLHEAVRLVAPVNYPLPGNTIAVDDLGTIPLILPSTHHGLRLLVEELAERHKFRLQISLECDGSISLMKCLVMENTGCTVLPLAAVMDEVSGKRLKTYRIPSPDMVRQVGLVHGRNRVSPEGLWSALRLVKNEIVRLVECGAWPDAELCEAATKVGLPINA